MSWGIDTIIAERKAEMDAPGYVPPAADLGYCKCGTVWNMDAMQQARRPRSECPDCGAAPLWTERAAELVQETTTE